MRLKDKVILLTGSTRGIGYEVAKSFFKEGAKVAVCGTDQKIAENSLAKMKEELNNIEIDAIAIGADIRNDEDIKLMVQKTMDKWGCIDVLVNNAGVTSSAHMLQETIQNVQNLFNINFMGTYRCIQEVAPIMKKQGYGNIINTTSFVGTYGGRGQSAYASSKFALNGLTKCCAKEFGPFNIRVNAVGPGCVLTDMLKDFPTPVLDQLSKATPVGRIAQPEDMCGVYVMLASDESKFMTGTIINVDGGLVF
ncbi:MAG: SDR family NAD(P)-dependent oxidoreductase [Peptostreptococcaceae bacterium]